MLLLKIIFLGFFNFTSFHQFGLVTHHNEFTGFSRLVILPHKKNQISKKKQIENILKCEKYKAKTICQMEENYSLCKVT